MVRWRCNFAAWPGFPLLVNHDCIVSSFPFRWALGPAAGQDAPAADPDGILLGRGAAGDEAAWQQLFDRWKKPLLAFFYRSLGSGPQAEDLTLEVFVRLHRSASRYEPRAPFATFLFHIARNLVLNELRRRRRDPVEPLPPDAFDYLVETETADVRRAAELEEVFQRALPLLPESDRTLLLLVQQQGLDHGDAARLLGITTNHLRVQLHRARQRLKEIMAVST